MSDFDPDAYLEQQSQTQPAFDPDAHLANAVPTTAPPAPSVTYDAAEFRRRVGRDPSPEELANFKATKGAGTETDTSASPLGTVIDRTLGGTIRGVIGGYKGLATLASGGTASQAASNVEGVTSQEAPGSPRTAAALASPYNPMNWIDESGQFLGNAAEKAGAPPIVSTSLRMAPDVAAAVLGVRKMGGPEGTPTMTEPEATQGAAPHPLQAVADAEASRISGSLAAGRAKGITLPDRTVSPNQTAANGIVQEELNLPPGSPITPKVLDAARQQFGSPGYQAVEQIPKIKLGSAYENDIANVDTSQIKDKFQPPDGGSITGARAVELSKYLREKATDYFKEGTVEANEKGQAHWDAAQAIEDAVERRLNATGQGQVADAWDAARTYYAKTYSVQSALDGAGNVVVPKLKTQLIKGKPLSGGLEDLATMGATNPEAFKTTPQAPQAGLIKRITAGVAPSAGATLGAVIGGGPGALAGELAGKKFGQKLLGQ